MGYVDFAKSLTYTDFEKTIKLFFDEIMALYNLVGANPMNISTEVEEPSSIRFILLTDSDEEAKTLFKLINDRVISIYDHRYTAKLDITDTNSLVIVLSEVTSG